MKKVLLSILFILPIFILSGCNNSNQSNTSNEANNITNLEISRTGTISNDTSINILTNETNENNKNNITNNEVENNISNETNNVSKNTTTNNVTEEPKKKEPVEKTLYEFSTTIKSKSSNRLNNIKLACSALNGTTVKSGGTFSFNNTVGKATVEKGYKKADVIVDKEVEQALGGGMCQVSSTLYNAALGVSNIQVTERHAHGKPVNYVEKGKDAAIAYGSKDLKFVNNTGSTIKIYANADNGSVNIRIVSIT